MNRRMFSSFTLLFVLVSLSLLACDVGTLMGSKPTIVIGSPPSGSQFRDGEDVSVQSTSTDSSGIVRVELLVDGNVVRTDPAPSPQVSYMLIQTWKATQGNHTLSVRAYNTSNTMSDPAAIAIAVAGTAVAPSVVPSTSIAQVATPANTPNPGPTVPGAATAAPAACTNLSQFVADVTVPDGTVIAAGQAYNKIWRLRNSGTCTWGTGYEFVFIAGEAMATTTVIAVPSTAPSATADFLIAMVAPAAPGTHSGQWQLKAPTGTLFGTKVNVTINVPGPATPTNTPPPVCPGAPVITSPLTASPTTINSGQSTTLSWGSVTNADSASIDQGIGGVATPGNMVVSPATTTTYTLTATGCGGTKTSQVTVTVNPTVPPAPAQVSPNDGVVLRVFPRVATFTWSPVTFPVALTYMIEVQVNTGSWQVHVVNGPIPGTSYIMPAFPGDQQGRWRVWASSVSTGDGTRSGWRNFSFSTGASQYVGTWVNDDASTLGVTRIVITNPAGQQLKVNPFGKCTPECDWGSKTQDLSGEPIVMSGFTGGGSHQLTITLNNNAGTSLKAVDAGGPGGAATYTFHR
jgi:hypothetical protein